MAHGMRLTTEQYEAYQHRRARECAQADFASGAIVDTNLRGSTPRTETNSDAGPAFREGAAVVRGASRVRPASEPRHVSVLLPWPPSKNRLYYNGTHFRTLVYRKFCADVAGIVRLVRAEPFKGEVHVQMDCYPPSNLGDVANIETATLDALQRSGIFPNDKAVKRLTVEFVKTTPGHGNVLVTIQDLT